MLNLTGTDGSDGYMGKDGFDAPHASVVDKDGSRETGDARRDDDAKGELEIGDGLVLGGGRLLPEDLGVVDEEISGAGAGAADARFVASDGDGNALCLQRFLVCIELCADDWRTECQLLVETQGGITHCLRRGWASVRDIQHRGNSGGPGCLGSVSMVGRTGSNTHLLRRRG